MNIYHKILLGMYVAAVLVVLGAFFDYMILAVTLLIILIISLLQKIVLHESVEKQSLRIDNLIGMMADRLGSIAGSVEKLGDEIRGGFSAFNARLDETRRTVDVESGSQYREMSGRIISLEAKLNEIKKNLGLAYDTLSERMEAERE